MTSYPIMTCILGRHYDLSWDAIMTSYPWDAIILCTRILGRHYDLVSWDGHYDPYPGTDHRILGRHTVGRHYDIWVSWDAIELVP